MAPPPGVVPSSDPEPFPVATLSPAAATGDELPSPTADDVGGCARSMGGVPLPLRRPAVEDNGSDDGTPTADDVEWLPLLVVAEAGDVGDRRPESDTEENIRSYQNALN